MRRIILIMIVSMFLTALHSQDMDFMEIMKTEKELRSSFDSLYRMQEGPQKDSLNQHILKTFGEALKTWDGYYYDWNGLDMIGKVSSEDGKLKVYTWYRQFSPDNYKYYGFIQYKTGKRKKEEINVVLLNDQSSDIEHPSTARTTPSNWFGVVYYGIHTFEYKRDKYYALLGYDFNNSRSRKKLVEILQLSEKDQPILGGEFVVEEKNLQRYVIEYSAQRVASLRYNPELDMIVFDHLVPFNPLFTGAYQFYGPEGSFDGLEFDEGRFMYIEDIDARNY